jgi:hypothetical protein
VSVRNRKRAQIESIPKLLTGRCCAL